MSSKLKPATDYTVPEIKRELDEKKISYKSSDLKADLYGKLEDHFAKEDEDGNEAESAPAQEIPEGSYGAVNYKGVVKRVFDTKKDAEDYAEKSGYEVKKG